MKVFIQPDVLDRASCRRARRAMDAGIVESAEVLAETIELDDRARRTQAIEVDPAILAEVEAALDVWLPAVAAFYHVALRGREGAGFLRYGPGDFYRPHRDRAVAGSWPDAASRRVSAVLFLVSSRDVDPAGSFAGGVLRLLPDGDAPVAIHAREGALVAFPADVLHEVTDVTDGVRDVVVDWYY